MALIDIFDEITEKQVVKTELGEQRIFGAMIGVVAENYSEEMPGRLCVNIPVRDENANQLKWAKMAFPYMGKNYGTYFLPEKDDQVVLVFEDGNIEKPFVVGCIPRDKDKYLKKTVHEKNGKKQIQTRNGSRITFEDDESEDGAKDKITVSTAGDAHQIVLDNEKKNITLWDKEKNCSIEMATESGKITVHAEQKLEITVGDSISIKMNGSSGSIKVEAQKVNVEAGKSLLLSTDGSAKLSGKQATLEAASTLKASSSGMVIVEGKPIKLG
jgi:uncharacterized protein involved in type VI secretion and phage assembly